jgi:hypothetical protein
MSTTRGRSRVTVSDLDVLVEAAATVEEPAVTRTRYGRISKPPEKYEPIEQVEDDYAEDDYNSSDNDGSADDVIETESDEEDDESDADSNGDLDGFVVPDKSESNDSDSDDGESSVPDKKPKRIPVKKLTSSSTRK